jgi:hypothetical protein
MRIFQFFFSKKIQALLNEAHRKGYQSGEQDTENKFKHEANSLKRREERLLYDEANIKNKYSVLAKEARELEERKSSLILEGMRGIFGQKKGNITFL